MINTPPELADGGVTSTSSATDREAYASLNVKVNLRLGLILLVLLGTALRWPSVFANSFHSDEALYANWARNIATGRDTLLRLQLVDKPPLLFYLQAIFYPMMGPVEFAARLPNFAASIASIPLLARLVQSIYRDERAALFAAGLLTLSPFAIQYSGTAFTDPLYVALGLGSLLALSHKHAGWSGILFGLAVATKYQVALYAPLLIAIAYLRGLGIADAKRWMQRFGLVLAGLVAWLLANSGGKNVGSYGDVRLFADLRLIDASEMLPRFTFWQGELWYVLGAPFLAVAALLLLVRLRGSHPFSNMLLALLIFVLGSYWLIAFPTYNRYLLPLVPLVAILLASGVSKLRFGGWIAVVVLLLMLPNAVRASESGFDFGGRVNADHGSAEIALYFKDAPYGTVLYDHWYSWQWRYHLYDTGVHIEWMPDADTLVENLDAFYDDSRYLALPNSPIADLYLPILAGGGYELQTLVSSSGTPSIVLYKIVRQP